VRYYALYGLALWLVGTLALRLVGQYLFGMPAVLLTYLVSTPAFFAVAARLLRRARLDPAERPLAGICLVLPGMLLDMLSVTFAARVFPNIPPAQGPAVAGWLLWSYGVALLTAFLVVRAPTAAAR
jgi:hypothetical protein